MTGSAKQLLRVAATTALIATLSIAGPARADNPPPPEPSGLFPQSLIDGCQRSFAGFTTANSPEWVYVYNTPSDQPPPPPRWVSGIASSNNSRFQAVHTSGADFAFGHDALDFNFNIRVDPEYQYLLAGHPASGSDTATGNYAGNGEESNRLHTEWEDLTIPKYTWPEPGDSVMEKGSWIWDCGHWGTPVNVFSPDYDLPNEGQPCPTPFVGDPSQCTITGEHSEFHPYRALFDLRHQSPLSPSGENQAEVFVSTDKTRAGKTEDCAHKFPPPPSLILPNPAVYPPEFQACVETEPNWQDVTGDYSFLVPAPAKPAPDAQLTFRAVNHDSVNAPAPTLTREGDAVRVTFSLSSAVSERVVEAYTIFVGWDTVTAATVPTHLKVTFDRLDIHRAMDPGCSVTAPAPGCELQSTRTNQASAPPGDWNIYWDVQGIWGQWPPGELLVNDGDSLAGTQSVDLYVPPGKGWRLFTHGRECDINAVDPARPLQDCPTNEELADNNDVPGLIEDTYASADASLGTHTSNALTRRDDPTSTCPDNVSGQNPNPNGCYSVTYTVERIDDAAERLRLPDLKLTKTDSPDPADVGAFLTYDLTVQNHGAATASGTTITDNLPAEVKFDSASASQGSCSASSGTVTCQLGGLAPGASASAQIKVVPQAGGTITNNASVSSDTSDTDNSDNTASESTRVVALYPRPRGATPLRAALVIAYDPCTNPNEEHQGPLAAPSCSPPSQQSNTLTVGTLDANGNPANSIGSVRLDVVPGNASTPADEADVKEAISITDVRRRDTLADYTGELREDMTIQVTDRYNGAALNDAATLQDISFPATVPCVATNDTGVGSTCSLSTTFDGLVSGSVLESKRSAWQIADLRLYDGGRDGVARTGPNTLFAAQGIFIP
jgi:uncharacterized repeat protein (TIGR01451 family)